MLVVLLLGMARSHLAIALAALCIALVATITLISQFGSRGTAPWATQLGYNGNNTETQQSLTNIAGDQYLLGVGKADITGPVVEINFMGYADPNQLGSGVRQRLYSRAFIIGDVDNPMDRFIYLVLDTQSGDTAVRYGILNGLKALGPDYDLYGQQNIAVTGTHSHSGPGAWLNYLLPQITSRGFNKQSYEAIVDGAIQSIVRAHHSLAPGRLSFGSIEIEDGNVNRSPYAYLANPESERQQYKHNVDKDLTLLKFQRESDGKDIGVLTWFPVHGTSMLGNNTLVTGDNKGVAAHLMEQYAQLVPPSATDDFVAGFSQANVGDTSPNVEGAYCESGDDVGKECDFKTSLCAGKTGPCHGRGPYWGRDDAGTASAYEIGRRQYLGARKLYESMNEAASGTPVTGSIVRSLHTFVDFSNRSFTLFNGSTARTCPAALGYSFAAGTTDGPGAFDFKQNNPGDPNANPFWSVVSNSLHEAGPEQIECQGVKPILLDVGETTSPYLWSPNIVDVQLLRVGQLYIIVSPGEATTMSGRRWKQALRESASGEHEEPLVVLGGPANSYTHYIATPEEYAIQRYEGASTMYGPHTLGAYINLTLSYLPYLSVDSKTSDASLPPSHRSLPELLPGPLPPNHLNASLSFITPVIVDRPNFFKSFGDVLDDVKPSYVVPPPSSDKPAPKISASFVGACPRNNLRLDGTYAAVQKLDVNTGVWTTIRDDSDWSLLYEWKRTSTVTGTSRVTVTWELEWETGSWGGRGGSQEVSQETSPASGDLKGRQQQDLDVIEELKGKYRLKYYGDSRSLGGAITAFEGASAEFVLV